MTIPALARLFAALTLLLGAIAGMPERGLAQSPDTQRDTQKAVLITGATSGIGLRMAQVLSQNGFFVYAGARKPEDIDRLNRMENVLAVRLDVTVQSDIDAAVALVRAEGRGLYGLINNAGVAVLGPLIETPEADLDFLLNVNLMGPYRVTRGFADLIIESRGRILNVTSIAGVVSAPFSGVYSMSKHGLEAFTDSLAAEMARFDVRVAAIEPGNYRSQILASMVARMQATGYSAQGSRYGSMLDLLTGPLDRSQFKEPDEVAQAALDFLTAPIPKPRYMVVPTRAEAELTLRRALQEAAQLNLDHQFSFSRDALVAMLDDAIQAEEKALTATPASAVGLHEAAFSGDLAALETALAQGADPDAPDATGATALIVATTFDRPGAVALLLAAGADVDKPNRDGSTPLHMAALLCRQEIVKALLAGGADRSVRTGTGATALDLVSVPFEQIEPVYGFLGSVLEPYGVTLDLDRIRATRPAIAALLAAG